MSEQTSSAPSPRRFPGFEIVEDLGAYRGLQRYKATQLALARPVVLNVLPLESAKNQVRAAFFDRQLEVHAALRHDNVVGAIAAGEAQGVRYFVTEYVDGATLHEALMQNASVWEVQRAVRVARDVARALVHLETLHLVHREITPRAIVLTDLGAARLIDFRRAKCLTTSTEETWNETSANAALYMSPEAARGEKGIDARTDIYSLGCVLYHLLAGRPPFYGRNVAFVIESLRTRLPRDPRWLRAEIPRDVVRVLDRCLRKSRDARYPNAAAALADLDAVLAGRPPAAAPPGSAWERPFSGR